MTERHSNVAFRVLAAAMLAAWALTLGTTLYSGLRFGALGLGVIARDGVAPEEGPVVVHVWEHAPETTLKVSDVLVDMGGRDLRGTSALSFRVDAAAAVEHRQPATVRVARQGSEWTEQLSLTEGQFPWWSPLPFSVAGVACVILLLWRAPHWRPVRRLFVAGLGVCSGFACVPYGVGPAAWSGAAAFIVLFPLGLALLCEVAAGFTDSALPIRAWQRWVPRALAALFSVTWIVLIFAPTPDRIELWFRLNNLNAIAFCILILVGLTRAYRRSDAGEQRQLRWVMYGFYLGVLPYLAADALWASGFADRWILGLGRLGLVGAPVGILVAIVGYRAFDIDRLIGRTGSYSLVGTASLVAGLLVIPRATEAASQMTGLQPPVTQVAVTLLLCAVAVPVHIALHARLDRVFLADQRALEAGLAELLEALPSYAGVEGMTLFACERIRDLFDSRSIVAYVRVGDTFGPIFTAGQVVPSALPAAGPVIAVIESLRGPVARGRFSGAGELDPFEHAALEALDCAAVAPIRRGDTLAAFVTLGARRSGDIYTGSHRVLLTGVCARISDQLARFDDQELLRGARALQERLRRYVPRAVAEHVDAGRELASGERDVTVLFVDVRESVGFAEKHTPDEVFAALDRHTEMVSSIVRTHGGEVVEFHGDGLLAVFGAPDPLPEKERQAVAAARRVAEAVERDRQAGAGFAIGIGIASGRGFVGHIRSADRWIWAVLGNPTNLAARLQALTRELHAVIAIDSATHASSRDACEGFRAHPATRIRGLSNAQDVYSLPLS